MKLLSEKRIIIFNCVALFFLLALPLFLIEFSSEKKHPKDEDLVGKFHAHKAEFEQLLQMFQDDKGLGRVSDFTRPENPESIGISRERIREYQRLFRKAGLEAGIEGYDEKEIIWFHASSQGLAVTGSGKGYAYTRKRPETVVDNLDSYWSKDGKSFTAFRHIEGNWYLYFEYED